MPGDIVVYVEHEKGRPRRSALEQVSKATGLAETTGGQVIAVVLGASARGAAEPLARFGADETRFSEDAAFDEFLTDPHVEALASIVEELRPAAVLFPYTTDGKDISSRLSARVASGAVANVVDLGPHDGRLDAYETVFGGNFTTEIQTRESATSIFLVRPNAFTPEEHPRSANPQEIRHSVSDGAKRARRGQAVQEEGAPIPVDEASIIVSGGRGLGGPEPFELLERLAEALGGVVGASRAAVDAGWISYAHQVGQTGRTVKPQLYIAIGISGAVQHRVGMQTADTIIAINKDPDAPIFQLADLAVVGDLFQIVPALTEEIQKRKAH